MDRNAVLLLTALLSLIGAGCVDPNDVPEKGPKGKLPFDGQPVGLAVPEGYNFQTAWRGSLTEWSAQTGARLTLSEYEASDPSVAVSQFSSADGESLVVFPLAELGTLIDKGALAPIPKNMQSADAINWSDLLPGLRDGLASPGKSPGFVPLSCPVLVCYYRQDLLNLAKLQPPETWEDYQRLLETLGDWAPGMTAVEPWGPDFRSTMFLARAVSLAKHSGNYSVFFDIESGTPQIDQPGFVRGLAMAQRAWISLSPDSRTLSPADCREQVLEGKAALAIALEPPYSDDPEAGSKLSSERAANVRIGVCRLPGSRESYNPSRRTWEPAPDKQVHHVTLVGFAGWGVGASANRDEGEQLAAWYAVSQLGSRGFVSGFPVATTSICRESQLTDLVGILNSGLEGGEAGLYVDAVALSLRDSQVVAELLVPRRRDFRAKLTDALTSVLEGGASPEAALKSVAAEWTAIVDEIGPDRLKKTYRAGLGLSPAASP